MDWKLSMQTSERTLVLFSLSFLTPLFFIMEWSKKCGVRYLFAVQWFSKVFGKISNLIMMILVLLKEHKERLANALLVCSIADDIAWFEIYLGEKKRKKNRKKEKEREKSFLNTSWERKNIVARQIFLQ